MTGAQLVSVFVFLIAFMLPMFLVFFFAFIWPVMRKRDGSDDTAATQSQPTGG
jgi:hypothetical protein